MFDRFVSLVQIVAVVACPMGCGEVVCCGGQGSITYECSSETEPALCPVQGIAECCRGDSTQDQHRETPSGCPDRTSCQCVCGGAVFEKPRELDGIDASCFLTLMDGDGTMMSLLSHFRTTGAEFQGCVGARNHGRSLRTLHMSFLC